MPVEGQAVPQAGTTRFGIGPLRRFSTLALEQLAAAREEIDALNVYPVPDGDTGTNLFLTFESAHAALLESLEEQGGEEGADLVTTMRAYRRGFLLGARGNSGVITAQLVGALLRRIGRAGVEERPADVLADGMVLATEASYAAVGTPVEGTILTVARAASDAAVEAAKDPDAGVEELFAAAAKAAAEALVHTPEQLEVLRDAGVVDAGGRGLCLVLEAAEAAFTGRRRTDRRRRRLDREVRRSGRKLAERGAGVPTDDLTEEGPAYEVMYLLDAPDDRVPALREALAPLGDSLVVVGGEGLWNVHVHVDDVGAAIEAGIEAGRPHRVRVTHFAEQVARATERRARDEADRRRRRKQRREQRKEQKEHKKDQKKELKRDQRQGRAVVVICFGGGLAATFGEAGAHVVEARLDRRPSTGELLEAVRATGAAEVALVPNAHDVVPAAEAAARLARDEGIRAAVIPTTAQVQAIAALAVHDPERPFDHDLVEMAAAARHARSGAVTVAVKQAITTAGLCEPGDVLGAVEGDFVVVGDDLVDVARQVIALMLGGGGELFTVISGAGGEEAARRCVEHLQQVHPTVEVQLYDGGQERYPLLFGVE
ncbi:DAK2 domain-containing protein [Nocardioides caldifontis]|uniref:DAK2 domain-containing protein n=1 Tax=Nocardioides caldifontis TaxID=2588938 RepID=UPI001EF01800|nr:DAK2 domain-containing protein [Nocardioides caldifontis]